MLVSWEWLSDYVDLNLEPDEMALKFAMSGLNHESTSQFGKDVVLDLEVTSNRGDCLGHIGVAREAAVLLSNALTVPQPSPAVGDEVVQDALAVNNGFEEGCPEYTARVIRGVEIGPSPEWMVRRLAAVGINSVNNVVDVTNYVMLECGQPLHAFDLKHIRGGEIRVRRAADKEQFVAIDHKTYTLDSNMVVIADAERAVALGGVMGGEESEVTESTTDLLIEAARFKPLLIRRAARVLKLHSPSSYRFERLPDPAGLDWASRRCCELILEVAGGQLAEGLVRGGTQAGLREQIPFRFRQVPRVLGIDVSSVRVQGILSALGCNVKSSEIEGRLEIEPPSWRNDLHREIDLVEEVARIHGYEEIPENIAVPIGVAPPRPKDSCLQRARHVLSAYGIDEAITPSVVGERLEQCGSLWTNATPLTVDTPLLVGSKLLRRSLLPSLLEARYTNQSQAGVNAQLYEVANIYLPASTTAGSLPKEQSTLGLIANGDLQLAKGTVETILAQVAGKSRSFDWRRIDHAFFEAASGLEIHVDGELLGFVGLVSNQIRQSLGLEQPVACGELNVDLLTQTLELVRTAQPVSAFPAISRDLNFIVDESLTWAELNATCAENGEDFLQTVQYCETYRDTEKDGKGKKRVLLSLHFQSLERTLTGEEVDSAVRSIIESCQKNHAAKLLG